MTHRTFPWLAVMAGLFMVLYSWWLSNRCAEDMSLCLGSHSLDTCVEELR